MKARPAKSLADFTRGMTLCHAITGETYTVAAPQSGNFAVAFSTAIITDPSQWLIVETGPPAVPLSEFVQMVGRLRRDKPDDHTRDPFGYSKLLKPFDDVLAEVEEIRLLTKLSEEHAAPGIVVTNSTTKGSDWVIWLERPKQQLKAEGKGKTKMAAIRDAYAKLKALPLQQAEQRLKEAFDKLKAHMAKSQVHVFKGNNAGLPADFAAKLEAMGCNIAHNEQVAIAPGWSVWFVDGDNPAKLVVKGSEKAMRDLIATTVNTKRQRWILADEFGRPQGEDLPEFQSKEDEIADQLLAEGRTIDDGYILHILASVVSTEEVRWNAEIEDTVCDRPRLEGTGTSPRGAILCALRAHPPIQSAPAAADEEEPADRPAPPAPQRPPVPFPEAKPLAAAEWPTPKAMPAPGRHDLMNEMPAPDMPIITGQQIEAMPDPDAPKDAPAEKCTCDDDGVFISSKCPVHGEASPSPLVRKDLAWPKAPQSKEEIEADDELIAEIQARATDGQVIEQAISVRQPWCWAILHAGKRHENRSRRMCPPGWYYLHASMSFRPRESAAAWDFIDKVAPGLYAKVSADPLPKGGIVGIIRIADWCEASTDPWFVGPMAAMIDQVQQIEFIPCRGALGAFYPKKAA